MCIAPRHASGHTCRTTLSCAEGVLGVKAVAESFFGTLQLELLDERHWDNCQHLALAVFEWIEAWYDPRRRHSYSNMLSPVDYEAAHSA